MKYAPPIISLPETWVLEAYRIKELLHQAKDDIELWANLLGFELARDSFIVRPPSLANIYGKKITIREGLNRKKEIEVIAHEYCHALFHPECVGFLDLNEFASGKLEGQAKEFAACVAWEE